ncbi:TPA: hypothetical protein N3C02_002814 [Vibrio parahaemolyticus]|nr:hypothetical protein [Vibrio parahaemolyticus]HAS6783889.1 hypothetical protein [Vibrio parahaemolyticus]HAS6793512.1 hypothetical protein [Vibrio parahaemolyticus]HAS6894911.1 hypothetical protein [Vibrio parahaemolyticus]HAS6898126.1 hypothetical protein [Vibrio parahaemolyticus]
MTRTTSFALVLLLMCAYFGYNRYYVYPQQLETQAKSMLIQMANREEWMDVFEMMNRVEAHKGHLELAARVKSSDGKRAYSEGFITYTDRDGMVCKEVVFNFKINSLKNYSISDLRDCSFGEYY